MFLHDWKDSGLAGLINDFQIKSEEIEPFEVLLASYTYEGYDGNAFVLMKRDQKLFEVNCGHCSCYGLEDQFQPEETCIESLQQRLEAGAFPEIKSELSLILNNLKTE